ncbi:SnoaL-like domain-containing protein (plasmid) [Rhodococcoides fascians A21d2]|uniref:nuclear transport factor 2 family protein n=1 Tax=Rhodococcoides fascians TaxID=1828 RepID=UPI00068A8E3D|nr:nuclear transport factor 2 family protein [Rhodococcus fascians]QII03683.1 SnoaL-like domain-containing protein [Rhodococcus fascians A21d2]
MSDNLHSRIDLTDNSIRDAILELISEFAYRVDCHEGRGVDDLFTEDAEYVLFGHPVVGRAAIRALYEHRRSRGPRTSRHLFGNVHLAAGEEDCVHATSVLTLHAADGLPPLPLPPVMIADYDDVVRRDERGVWKFQRRQIAVAFHAGNC